VPEDVCGVKLFGAPEIPPETTHPVAAIR